MHHERLVALAVFADILQPEALGQVEVELHGGELPQAADGVHQLDVDLRPVERGFAGNQLVRDAAPLQNILQRASANSHCSSLPMKVLRSLGSQVESSTWYCSKP